jgi:hypothetical protein
MKRIYYLHYLLTIVIFSATFSIVEAQDNFRHIKDSLLQLIPSLEGA